MRLSTKLSVAIELAATHNACDGDMDQLIKLNDENPDMKLSDLLDHESAPAWACWVARNVIGGRWKPAEPTIMTDPFAASRYASFVIGGRWEEAESVIMTDPWAAHKYARDVIGGRWKEAESIIMTKPFAASQYAREVIGGRWKEAESIIIADSDIRGAYQSHVLRKSPIMDQLAFMFRALLYK